MKNIAYLVIYKGRVQGVGFRYTVLRFAQGYDSLTGYVKNRQDGAVEMYIEGKDYEVESLLEDITMGPHAGYIKEVITNLMPPCGMYSDFKVEY
jgi:acylphosphatase